MLVFVKTKKEIVSGSCRYLSDKSPTGVIALNELHSLLNNSIIFLMFIKDISVQSYEIHVYVIIPWKISAMLAAYTSPKQREARRHTCKDCLPPRLSLDPPRRR